MQKVSHKTLFEKLRDDYVISRCTMYAHWTLPQLMADFEVNTDGSVVVERDYQEIGALLTNHLSSKLARLLFPADHPFFRMHLAAKTERELTAQGITKEEAQSGIAQMELKASKQLFVNASYAQLILLLKHLIVTGQALLYRDTKKQRTVTYGIQSFVTRRDGAGDVLDCVLREFTYAEALAPDMREELKRRDKAKYSRDEQRVELYTRIQRRWQGDVLGYEVTRAVDQYDVGTAEWYPQHLCPWRVVHWSIIPGEHYARGMVEDYAGGFAKLSDLSESAALYSIEMMRVVNLVSAGSGTDIDDLQQAESGEYVRGDPASVQAHEAGDAAKLQQVASEIAAVYSRLSRAFMYGANTRDAERVTAYELQREAQEAEHALGGVYSSLAESLQMPLAYLTLTEVSDDVLPGLVTGQVKPDIVAGIPALGRSSDVQNLVAAAQEAAAVIPVLQQLDNRVDPKKLLDIIFAGRSVDPSLVFKSKEQMSEEAKAMQQQQQGQQQITQAADLADQAAQLQQLQGQV